MSHRVLYVEKSNELKLYLDNLKVILESNDEVLFPISDIMILVIDNYRSTISVPLINKLTENNVCTILCGVDHLPRSYILPMNGHFSQSGNINKQIRWSSQNKKKVHQLIVQAKIFNQVEILKYNDLDFDVIKKLYQFRDEVEEGDPTNREGLAAKMYFRELFGEDFARMDEDVINAGLNYGYAVFRALISSILVSKGYLPNLGIFHRGKQNMFNLSDDIIEVFRPMVDQFVYTHMKEEILFKQEHREGLIQLTLKKVVIDDKTQTMANAINLYIESIIKVLHSGKKQDFIFPLPYCYDL